MNKCSKNICLLILGAILTVAAPNSFAASEKGLNKSHQSIMLNKRKQFTNPFENLHTLVVEHFYIDLDGNERFIKWKDMLNFFWQQQNGEHRIAGIEQKRFAQQAEHPVRGFQRR